MAPDGYVGSVGSTDYVNPISRFFKPISDAMHQVLSPLEDMLHERRLKKSHEALAEAHQSMHYLDIADNILDSKNLEISNDDMGSRNFLARKNFGQLEYFARNVFYPLHGEKLDFSASGDSMQDLRDLRRYVFDDASFTGFAEANGLKGGTYFETMFVGWVESSPVEGFPEISDAIDCFYKQLIREEVMAIETIAKKYHRDVDLVADDFENMVHLGSDMTIAEHFKAEFIDGYEEMFKTVRDVDFNEFLRTYQEPEKLLEIGREQLKVPST